MINLVRLILVAATCWYSFNCSTGACAQDSPLSQFAPKDGVRVTKVVSPTKLSKRPAAATYGKSATTIQNALLPLLDKVAEHVVTLENLDGHRTLGTIVSARGYVVGKRSELTRELKCIVDGKSVQATVIASHTEYDLALVQIDSQALEAPLSPITFSPQVMNGRSLNTGRLVVSFSNEKDSAKLGTVSVRKQRFAIAQPACTDCVNLGLVVSSTRVAKKIETDEGLNDRVGLKVTRVYPRTASERCGLLVGDLLYEVNGKAVLGERDLSNVAQNLRIGQTLELKVIRDSDSVSLSTVINRLSPRMPHDLWGGGPFSEKRFGFTEVITHDSAIYPEDCGGPFFGLNGDVLGVNIARSMRVATFAVTLERVHSFVKLAKPNIVLKYQ